MVEMTEADAKNHAEDHAHVYVTDEDVSRFTDALGLLRRTAKNYKWDDVVSRDAATEARRSMLDAYDRDGGAQDLYFTEDELTLIWSGLADMLDTQMDDEKIHAAANTLTGWEATEKGGLRATVFDTGEVF